MLAHCGRYFYWMATCLAALIAAIALGNCYANASAGEPIVPVTALFVAAFIWLIGWVGRSVLAEC